MADPILKEAMIKIKAILDEYEMGGNIAICSRKGFESLYHFPSWSVAKIKGNHLHFKSNVEDFESRESQHRDTEDTVGIIYGIRDLGYLSYMQFDNIAKELEKVMDITHIPFDGFEEHFEN